MPLAVIGPCLRRASKASHLAVVLAGLPAVNAHSCLPRWPQMRRNAANVLAAPVVLPMRIRSLRLAFGRPPLVQAVGATLPSSTILPTRRGNRLAYVAPRYVP